MRLLTLLILLMAATAVPSFAATYWIIARPYQGCSVVEQAQQPASVGGAKVIGSSGYSSDQDAQSAMQHAHACSGVH
jgi:hypothetical protein